MMMMEAVVVVRRRKEEKDGGNLHLVASSYDAPGSWHANLVEEAFANLLLLLVLRLSPTGVSQRWAGAEWLWDGAWHPKSPW